MQIYPLAEVLLLVFSGMIISTLGALIGLGGGFLAVPYLILVWSLDRELAVFSSLMLVLANSTSGSISYIRSRMIDWKFAVFIFVPTVPGLILGYFILKNLDSMVFDILFSMLLLIMTSYIMIKHFLNKNEKSKKEVRVDGWGKKILAVPISFAAGTISSTFGVGGGSIFMPVQVGLLDLNMRKAVANSMFIIAMMAVIRVFVISYGYFSVDHLQYGLPLALGALIGGYAGAHVVKNIKKSRPLIYLLAVFLFLIAVYMGLNGLFRFL
ncbi:MAG: sulfite exporter TauE/SafE family protein [Thermoplasmatota archaeon]